MPLAGPPANVVNRDFHKTEKKMTRMLHFHHAGLPDELAAGLARYVAERLKEAVLARGKALLIVSGGSTPVPFLRALSDMPLDWPSVTVTLADERWVGPTHADSNERLVREHLLRGDAARARFVPLYNGAATPQDGLAHVEEALAALPWPADVTVLGMGGDGHTASLFPHAPELPAALDDTAPGRALAVASPKAPNVPVPRVSLNRKSLLDAALLVLHVTGDGKVPVLRQALQEGPVADMPIRLALHQSRVPCHVFQAP